MERFKNHLFSETCIFFPVIFKCLAKGNYFFQLIYNERLTFCLFGCTYLSLCLLSQCSICSEQKYLVLTGSPDHHPDDEANIKYQSSSTKTLLKDIS